VEGREGHTFAVTKTKATTIRHTALKAIVRTRGEAATKK